MKTYKGPKLYSILTPDPWYKKDNLFEPLKNIEPYSFIHHLENNTKVKYLIDEFGFRNFNNIDSNLWFFGCSLTFGEALDYEKTFPYIISNKLNVSFYNFGTCGASIDLITRLLYKLKNKFKEKTIVILLPHSSRYETLIDNQYYNFVSNHTEYLKHLSIHEPVDTLKYKLLKNIMLLKLLTENTNTHFFTNEDNEILNTNLNIKKINDEIIVDYAPDNNHYGEETNKNIATLILDNIFGKNF